MNCQFCGKSVKKLFAGPNDVALCEECYASANAHEDHPNNVVELPVAPVEEAPKEIPIRCALSVGVKADGSLFLETTGYEVDLLLAEGLISYAQRRLKQQWDINDLTAAQAARARAEQEQKVE